MHGCLGEISYHNNRWASSSKVTLTNYVSTGVAEPESTPEKANSEPEPSNAQVTPKAESDERKAGL